ncbi:MAG: DUF4058 family protein [Chloroflexota bacterium]
MSYPFPGMNPWLEDRQLWRGVHTRLITALGDALSPDLAPRYFVDVETHTYIAKMPDEPITMRYPDITVLEVGGGAVAVKPTATHAMPLEIDLPFRETIEEPYLSIRLVETGEVVTVIELLSHTNKRAGTERRSYLEKRETFLDADVHFVEIDLLRAFGSMPYTEEGETKDYRIFIHRKETRRKALLYIFNVRDSIPVFPLPLLPDDLEPSVDLGGLLQDIYTRARYRLIINYTQPPSPQLRSQDAEWAKELISSATL